MQKGGGIIIKPSEAHRTKQDIVTFLLNNSVIEIFSYETRGGIILKLELNSEIASPYMSVNPESLGQDVKIIFFKLVFIGTEDFDIYDKNDDKIIYLNQASKLDFEKEVTIQNDIYKKTQGVNLSPLCPAVLDSYHLDDREICKNFLSKCRDTFKTQEEQKLFNLIITHFNGGNFTIGLQVMEYIENSKTLASYIYDEQNIKIDTKLTKDLYTLAFFKLKTLHSLGYIHNDLHSSNVLVKKIDNCVCSIGKSCCCLDGYDVLIIDFGRTGQLRNKQDFVDSIYLEYEKSDLIKQFKRNFYTYDSESKEIEKCVKNKVKEFILNTPNAKKIYKDMGLQEQYIKFIIAALNEMYPGTTEKGLEELVNTYINNDKPLKELLSETEEYMIENLSKQMGVNKSIIEKVFKFTEDKEKGVKFHYAISEKILQLYKHLNQTEYNKDITKTLFEILLQIPDITNEQAKEILELQEEKKIQVKDFLLLYKETNVDVDYIIELSDIPFNVEQIKRIVELHKETNISIDTIIKLFYIPFHFEQIKHIAELHKETNISIETIVNIMKIPNATIDITRQLLQLHKETNVPIETIVKTIGDTTIFFNSNGVNIGPKDAIEIIKLIRYLNIQGIHVNYEQVFAIVLLHARTKIDPFIIYHYLNNNPNAKDLSTAAADLMMRRGGKTHGKKTRGKKTHGGKTRGKKTRGKKTRRGKTRRNKKVVM